ncbi:MAG: right-handed parallel beta-helix repeat-containing protein, partial [Candidatus Thorarchaeota archaeon]
MALPMVTVSVNYSSYQDRSESFSNATQSSPIIIQGDNDLISLGLLGDGSQGSPFLLDGLTITSNDDESCVSVSDITLHLKISNCVLTGYEIPAHPYSVIHINNVSSSVIVQGCIINTYGLYGVLIQGSTSVTVEDCTINPLEDAEFGISVHNSTDVTVSGCDVGTQYIYISDDFLGYFGITNNVTVNDCQSGGISIGSFVTGQ